MREQMEILTHATHVNGREPAVYMSCMSQNFRYTYRIYPFETFDFFSARVSGLVIASSAGGQ